MSVTRSKTGGKKPALPPFFARFSLHGLPPGTRLGLAVSGGADSIALARAAHAMAPQRGWVLRLLHVQHGLRGPDSIADAVFVQALAQQLDLPYLQIDTNAAEFARHSSRGLEETGRLLRYGWFRQLLLAGELDAIATGHTLDDQAETVLAKLLRGAWTAGLSGIAPLIPAADLPGAAQPASDQLPERTREIKELRHPERSRPRAGAVEGPASLPASPASPLRHGSHNPGILVRPLLTTRRDDLRRYLTSLNQSWQEDATNADPRFTRNRIRHELLPVLATYNPQLAEHLTQIAALAQDDEAYWQAEVQRLLPGLLLPGRPVRGGGRSSSTVPGEQSLAIEVDRLCALPRALTRRMLRATAARLGATLDYEETARALGLLESPVGSTPRREQLTAELRIERSPRELRFILAPAANRSSRPRIKEASR